MRSSSSTAARASSASRLPCSRNARAILWLDAGSALGAGATVIALHGWLARLHVVAPEVVLAIGIASVVYGTYTGALAILATVRRRLPARRAIELLVVANVVWSCVCIGLLATVGRPPSALYRLHVGLEGAYVALLPRPSGGGSGPLGMIG